MKINLNEVWGKIIVPLITNDHLLGFSFVKEP